MWIQSLIVAFSMYSKIPMPRIEWNEKNMRYALCFFPAVGVAVALGMYLVVSGCSFWGMGNVFTGCIATVVPILLTGGIHMDGYLDTIDALSSYGDREKRLEILKDSHCGAFAIIFGMVYVILSVGIWSEMSQDAMVFMGVGYVMSRTLSGLSIAAFPLAKNTGLVAAFQDGANKKNVKRILTLLFLIETAFLLYRNLCTGVVVVVVVLISFGYHYYVCKKIFGGITGDLAGYFLQICELAIAGALVIIAKLGI